ncbi:hypothetical protein MASR2M8_05020 [Opitutaceae bacterium]
MMKSAFRLFSFLALAILGLASVRAQENVILLYDGYYRNVEGSAPFPSANGTYDIEIKLTALSESTYAATTFPLTVPLQVVSLSRPADVSEASALSFITVNPNPVLLPAGNGSWEYNDQFTRTFTISIHVPVGFTAGDYGYQIKTLGLALPDGLALVDEGTFINMKVLPPTAGNQPPTVKINTPQDQSHYTYTPANGPLLIPFDFSASANGSSTILTVDADLNNLSIPVTSTGIGTNSATGSGTLSITSGGLFTLRARASNGTQTSSDSVEFNVTVAALPVTLTALQPLNNAVYDLTLGQSLTVPLDARALSTYGPITSFTATLNGTPVAGLSTTGLNTLQARATGAVGITAPGSYTVVYTASNVSGPVSRTVNFTVNGITPPPVVTIGQPAVDTVVERYTGDAPSVVPFTFQANSPYGPIQSVSVTLDGQPVSATTSGLQTSNATGSGNFNVTTPGTYTMVVTASNGGAVASASRTFTVVETAPPLNYTLNWLPPISTGVAVEGGTTVPIKFTLTNSNGATVSDQNVIIAIYEVFPNGTSSNPVLFPYGTSGPAAPDYAISGGVYQLDYATADGAHVYKVEVYSASSSSAVLLGAKQLTTFAAPEPEICCGDEIMVRNMPTINGTVNGSIRVLNPGSVTLNGGAAITGNLYVVGTPTVRLNGKPDFGGTLEGSGASSPTNYQITLNGKSTLGNLVRKTDPLVMPTVTAPASPTGTQSVTINSSSQAITNWTTVKNLTLNGNVGSHVVPPGSYGSFISNGNNSGFTLGVAGSTVPAVYSFESLTLNGQTKIELLGPVIITVKNSLVSNGTMGSASNPDWLTLNISNGGFTLNSGNGFYGCVIAPNGTVIINGNTQFVGGIISDRLTVNGGASLLQVAP